MENLLGLVRQKFRKCLTWLCWHVTHRPWIRDKNFSILSSPSHIHTSRPPWNAASGLQLQPKFYHFHSKRLPHIIPQVCKPWEVVQLPWWSSTPQDHLPSGGVLFLLTGPCSLPEVAPSHMKPPFLKQVLRKLLCKPLQTAQEQGVLSRIVVLGCWWTLVCHLKCGMSSLTHIHLRWHYLILWCFKNQFQLNNWVKQNTELWNQNK